MNLDTNEFMRGYCQEFEKMATQPWQKGMGELNWNSAPSLVPESSGGWGKSLENGIKGIGDFAGTASMGSQGINNIADNKIITGAQGMAKMDPHGNVIADKPQIVNQMAGSVGDAAWDWAGKHKGLLGGIGAGLVGLPMLMSMMGGRGQQPAQQPVVNNYYGSQGQPGQRSNTPSFFPKG